MFDCDENGVSSLKGDKDGEVASNSGRRTRTRRMLMSRITPMEVCVLASKWVTGERGGAIFSAGNDDLKAR